MPSYTPNDLFLMNVGEFRKRVKEIARDERAISRHSNRGTFSSSFFTLYCGAATTCSAAADARSAFHRARLPRPVSMASRYGAPRAAPSSVKVEVKKKKGGSCNARDP